MTFGARLTVVSGLGVLVAAGAAVATHLAGHSYTYSCGPCGTNTCAQAFACLQDTSRPTVTVPAGTYTSQYNVSNQPANTNLDAHTNVVFESSSTNKYPVVVRETNAAGLCWNGGKFKGLWDTSWTWGQMHDANNAAWVAKSATPSVDGVRANNVTDGVRLEPNTQTIADTNFTIRQVWLSNIRDDCIEDDRLQGGLVDDVLFDGCYVGISTRATDTSFDGTNRTITVNDSMIGLKAMKGTRTGKGICVGGTEDGAACCDPSLADTNPCSPQDLCAGGGVCSGHNMFFKVLSSGKSPRLQLTDNLFYAEDVPNDGASGLCPPLTYLTACSNNTIVWAGSGAFPTTCSLGSFPASCWQVTTDTSIWNNAVAAWKTAHPHVPDIQ
ncbi:MAG TPA: hypothetical protein VKA21_14535 [Candidatus Binatia bacterium]|nr:hypothetical protein [Candidatus Binatia bacterium]